MLENIISSDVLFLDIETVPQYKSFSELPDNFKYLWEKKSLKIQTNNDLTDPEELYKRAGIYAEFGKIICISLGVFDFRNNQRCLRITSLFGDDEKSILLDFKDILESFRKNRENIYLCAHNGKEFDFPYIARRMLLNEISLPEVLNVAGKKPWETTFIDTMELWKFGDHKHYTSLELLAAIFNLKSPKEEIDGSQVSSLYWDKHDFDAIIKYCENDVITVAQLFLKYKGENIIDDENILRIKR